MSENNLNIQMVDLKGQYEKIKTQVDQAINDVYTRYAIGKATRIIPELSRYLGEHGGKRKTKKRNNIKKSSKKKSKRIH